MHFSYNYILPLALNEKNIYFVKVYSLYIGDKWGRIKIRHYLLACISNLIYCTDNHLSIEFIML